MKTSMVLARDVYKVIGVDGKLPWHCPADLALFKRLTANKIIVMGRKTWDSLPVKPLPNRVNIVVTNDVTTVDGAHAVVNSVERAIEAAELFKDKAAEIVFIGGASIYEQVVRYVDEVHISEMNLVADGKDEDKVIFDHDFTYALWPDPENSEWDLVANEPWLDSETGVELFEHIHLRRK